MRSAQPTSEVTLEPPVRRRRLRIERNLCVSLCMTAIVWSSTETGAVEPTETAPTEIAPTETVPATQPSLMRELSRLLTNPAGKTAGTSDAPASRTHVASSSRHDDLEQEAPETSGVAISDLGLLDVHVRDIDIPTLLEMLSYQARRNIVTSKSVTGSISANLYEVTLPEALDAILLPNGYGYRQSGKTIFVATIQEIALQGPPPETRVFKLRYISRAEAMPAIAALLGPEASIATDANTAGQARGASGEVTSTSAELVIVTDMPERLDAVERLLREIDVRPRQILIEATILRATLNEQNQLGIDFTLLGGVDLQNVMSTSNASQDLQTGRLPSDALQKTTFNINTDVIPDIDGGLSFGIINDSIAAFVRALEEITDVAVVANPKVIALNRQEGRVIVGRRDGYLTTTVTDTAAIQSIEFLETGTQVRFRPFIMGDSTIRLVIHPKDSNGGLTTANLPFEETTEVESDILVEDGHTVLVGGLFRERTIASKSQLPLIGDIPVLGLLTKGSTDQTIREEVIVLLTVHILKETSEENARFTELLEDVERVRVGTRRGLLGIGRERLAQAFYQEAVRQAERDNTHAALLNVNMALHNQPKQLAAIQLKERLQGRRLWEEEGGRMRTFTLELLSNAPDGSQAPFGRPDPRPRFDDTSRPGADGVTNP